MGMDSLSQIERLFALRPAHHSIITKIGASHIGLLGGKEHRARQGGESLRHGSSTRELREASFQLILNGEDEFTVYHRCVRQKAGRRGRGAVRRLADDDVMPPT